ncbi:hypothetical protein EXIGLDRAFT_760431 [Exidia glandulosa HHB12029]|uniref:F-box domain-containing protein n=1 Tax=Exidia glandulosa HHB12029 TaxID=1314781 RepID=A0A165P998_EXIGL|nr:hypothetical protein EXIGLDRAFT_760431 [Exidia glandulosa HHB12029]
MTDTKSPLVLLPTDLEGELAETALRVFRAAQQRSCATTDTNTIGNLVQLMLDCVKSALLPDLRTHNAAQIARAGLPDELWCMIWGHLSMEDRVRVTHVCGAWRQLAVGTPRLWCSLDLFSSRHDVDCDCDRCSFLQDEDAICDRCDDYLLVGRSNIVLVTALLPRSQQLPLHLHVDAPHCNTDGDVLDELAVALLAHAHRLEVISIDSEDENTVLCLFNGLGPTLPALRVLDCKAACLPTLVQALPATLPCLQTVDLRDGWGHFEDEADVPSFPSVHTLHFRLIYQKDLDSYLNTFPSVQHLHVTLSSEAMRTTPAVPLSGRTNAGSISSVHVYDVSPGYEDAVLALFYDVRLPLLVLVYDPSSEDISKCPTPYSGLHIFVDLSRPTMLHCSAMDAKNAVLSAEGDGKRREIRIPSSVVGLLWQSLSTTHLSTVRIDASLFFDLFSGSVPPEFPALRLFEIALKASDDFIDVLREDIIRRIPSISAPSLDTLRILNLDSSSHARIDASHIALFANLLRGGRVLRTLSLRHVLVVGDSLELSAIADIVDFGAYGGISG